MRGIGSILIVLVVCVVVVLLYWFLGKPQLDNRTKVLTKESDELSTRLSAIERKEVQMPKLLKEMPKWAGQLELFTGAIPSDIKDEVFLDHIAEQLEEQEIDLLGLEVVKGGPWLGEIGEAQEEELIAKGIDPNMAKQIRVAYYTIRVIGEFDNVLNAFENLKRYKRLYTIDELSSPAGGGAGVIQASIGTQWVPIQITGRIYYGLNNKNISISELEDIFQEVILNPRARNISTGIISRAKTVDRKVASTNRLIEPSLDDSEPTETPSNPSPVEEPVSGELTEQNGEVDESNEKPSSLEASYHESNRSKSNKSAWGVS